MGGKNRGRRLKLQHALLPTQTQRRAMIYSEPEAEDSAFFLSDLDQEELFGQ